MAYFLFFVLLTLSLSSPSLGDSTFSFSAFDVTCCGDTSVRVLCWAVAASLNGSMPIYEASIEATRGEDEWIKGGRWKANLASDVTMRYVPATTSRDLQECVREEGDSKRAKWLVLSIGLYDAIQATPIGDFEKDITSFFSSQTTLKHNMIIRTVSPWTQSPSQVPVFHNMPVHEYDDALKKVSSQYALQRSSGASWLLLNTSALYSPSRPHNFLRALSIDAEGLSALLNGLKTTPSFSRLGESNADPSEASNGWQSVLFHDIFDWKLSSVIRLTFLYSIAVSFSLVFGTFLLHLQGIGWHTLLSSWNTEDSSPSSSSPPSVDHPVEMSNDEGEIKEVVNEYWWEWLMREKVIFTAIRSWCVIASVVFLCYLLDGARFLPAGGKTYEFDTYVFVTLVITLICCLSVQPAHVAKGHSGILNRDQTEEWRGWMQVAFLLYHYYDAKPFYNYIRVFVASYVWQTGFGHFSYFWVRKDWSLLRFVRSMFRMNFLVILLVLMMQTDYVHYYICPMHSLFFIFVWALTYPFHEMNAVTWVISTKFVLIFLFCHFLWANETIFNAIFGVVPIFFENGSMHEWYFRSGLDRYATSFGMVFAFCYPFMEKTLSAIESMDVLSSLAVKSMIGLASVTCLGLWYYFVGSIENKFVYNSIHPYTSFIPITFFIVLRNLSATFRKNYFWGFGTIGKITLETYLLQFHLMLANNNKFLVQFIDSPLLNFLITWILLLFFSQNAFQSTDTLNNFFFPLKTPFSAIAHRLAWCFSLGAALFLISLFLIFVQVDALLYFTLLATPCAIAFLLMQQRAHLKS